MKHIKYTIIGILAVLFIIVMLPSFDFNLNLVYLAFIGGNLLFVVLVYSILKYGNASTKKFDAGNWYEDESTKKSN